MNCSKNDMLLYAVTDRSWLGDESLYSQVEKALEGGATFIQLREKKLDYDSFLDEAREIKKLCARYKVPFVIDDNVDIAIAVDADGVHVGQSDMEARKVREKLGPNKIIGVTAKTVEQALRAVESGADYLGVGAAFATSSKSDTRVICHDTIRDICKAVDIPVVAIGGICSSNIMQLKGLGVCGVAVISAIFAKKDIKKAARELRELSDEMVYANETDCPKEPVSMKTALSIAGSDSSGGAGIQADIKTMQSNGVFAMTAITALTAQNTTGVSGIMEASPEFLEKQLDAVFTDIFPDAVKIGMVSSPELIRVIAKKLVEYKAKNIVLDPVMVATSGSSLCSSEAVEVMKKLLFPLVAVLTPNIPETEVLYGAKIENEEDMIAAAKAISDKYNIAVLCKGGHKVNDANDLLVYKGKCRWFIGERIDNPNTHGTGCTLSSAIASNLAKGYDIETAIERSKRYISGALSAMLDLGKGSGPLAHGFDIRGEFVE